MKKVLFALMLVLFCGTPSRAQQIPSPSTSVSTQQLTLLPQAPVAVVNTVQERPSIQGNATYYYWFVSNVGGVISPPAGPFPVFNAPATLGGINTVTVTWNPAPGVTTYDVLRTTSSTAPTGACGCAVIIGTASATLVDNIPTASLGAYTVATSSSQLPVTITNTTSLGLNPAVPNTWGPGVAGTGALQTFTHPTGGTSNQYNEILLEPDQNVLDDRNLFNVCGYTALNGCIGQFHIGADNDQNVVESWNGVSFAIVGAQSESDPMLLYTPVAVTSGSTIEWTPTSLANTCINFNACKNGNLHLAGGLDNGIIGCISNWDSTNHVILASCMPNTVYSHTGAIQNSEGTHIVQDTATMTAGVVTITLSGSAAFASATSYTCTANDQSQTNAVRVIQSSGTSFQLAGTSSSDVIRYICIGN